MSGLSLYEVSAGTFTKGLTALLNILNKAEAYAKEKGVDAESYVATALCEDMKPLSFQVQVGSSYWKLLAGHPPADLRHRSRPTRSKSRSGV